jgi:hypothetical protein
MASSRRESRTPCAACGGDQVRRLRHGRAGPSVGDPTHRARVARDRGRAHPGAEQGGARDTGANLRTFQRPPTMALELVGQLSESFTHWLDQSVGSASSGSGARAAAAASRRSPVDNAASTAPRSDPERLLARLSLL